MARRPTGVLKQVEGPAQSAHAGSRELMAELDHAQITQQALPPTNDPRKSSVRFLDAEGNSVSPAIDARTIGMPLEAVRKVPEKIMAAAGPHKVPILRAALATGLVDTLVTDDVTAELLLDATK